MLRELAVRNLALIEDVRVELEAGFCAWTGETGAGKTLLLAAVGLLLGERGSTDLIRAGADELHITGRFTVEPGGFGDVIETPIEDDEIILSRRLTRGGRSYAYLNDQPIAVATLKRGQRLVDMHSQHESQALTRSALSASPDAFGEADPTVPGIHPGRWFALQEQRTLERSPAASAGLSCCVSRG